MFGDSVSEPVPIAFCITDLDRGGAELAMFQVVTRLDRDQWAPHVYCLTQRGKLADELEEHGVPVTCYGLTKWNLPLVLWRLRSAFKNTRTVILQTFLYHANILGRIAGWLAGVPHVVSGIRVAEKRGRVRLWIDRWTDRFVSRHVCVSQSVADFSAEQGGLPASKLVVVPNGVDVPRFKNASPADLTQFEIPKDAFTLLFVGRLEPQKAPEVLIDGVSPLLPLYPELHVLIVGAGSLESSVRDQVAARETGKRVHFAGRRRDVPEIMRACDCLVLVSRWEGMPNVVLEAAAAGLPIISTEVEGVRELLVSDSIAATIIPIDQPDSLKNAIVSHVEQRVEFADLARASQSIVAKHFTWDATASAFEAIYQGLLRR